ncbi:MAG: DUF1295 domain-containing protein [Paracoccaceae bacterium]
MDQTTIFLSALGVGLGGFLALWPVSLIVRDASIVDVWWGPGIFCALALAWFLAGAPTHPRALLLLAIVGAWSLRLGFVMLRRRARHGAEDRRYQEMRARFGAGFWWKSLIVIFLLQGTLQWIIGLAAYSGVISPAPLGLAGVLGALLAFAGLAIEARSDQELDRFKRVAAPDALLTSGLRAHVRHPSYAGEIILWWGVWLLTAGAGAWWTLISPVLLTFLLLKVSGAPIAADGLRRTKTGYAEWAARTPAFLPWRRGG